ncbi:hypothetical protein DID75_03050 [Candidatus Marinamargulisbacteria bacterium SCGC AG-410-N11]|nr:hypothetical protein DID75_03050 [Candidatus Marinamargulisbacteria bacterium SCGC AG-410-N11]
MNNSNHVGLPSAKMVIEAKQSDKGKVYKNHCGTAAELLDVLERGFLVRVTVADSVTATSSVSSKSTSLGVVEGFRTVFGNLSNFLSVSYNHKPSNLSQDNRQKTSQTSSIEEGNQPIESSKEGENSNHVILTIN